MRPQSSFSIYGTDVSEASSGCAPVALIHPALTKGESGPLAMGIVGNGGLGSQGSSFEGEYH